MSDSLQPHGLYLACKVPLSMGFPSQEHWSRYFLLQRIFPTQGKNLCLLLGRQILLPLGHLRSPIM